MFIAFFQVSVIHLFRFGDHGVHDVGLPAELQFFLDEFVDLQASGFKGVVRGDGFPAGRKLVDHRYIQVSVEGHGERPGNGSCCHDQYVWRDRVLLPQFSSLGNTETMLLVDNNKSHVFKIHHVFQ